MDHLPEIRDPQHAAWSVPLLFKREDIYDGTGFSTFPERKGVQIQDLISGTHNDRFPLESAGLLQSWLYFGLLTEIFIVSDIRVNTDDFIEPSKAADEPLFIETTHTFQSLRVTAKVPISSIVTTKALNSYILRWGEVVSGLSLEQQKKDIVKMIALLKEAREIMNVLRSPPAGLYDRAILPHVVSISICILGETLEQSLIQIYNNEAIDNLQEESIGTSWPYADFPRIRMREDGWCESHTPILRLTATTYFAGMLKRPLMKKDHQSCHSGQCLAYQVVDTQYKTRHVTDDCNCEEINVDFHQISTILESGKIPRLRIETVNGQIQLRLTDQQQYTAISHVWAHGLGNQGGNALPRCQLEKLRNDVLAIPSQGTDGDRGIASLWIDTLCVPIDDKWRKSAVQAMRKTYQEAENILVLDAELQEVSASASPEEIYVRIACSGWMTRLWTFQEAVLAKKIYIKLADAVVDLETLGNRASNLSYVFGHVRWHLLMSSLKNLSPEILGGFLSPLLCHVIGHARRRSTSKPKDEVTCLSTLMQLDPDAITDGPVEERMAQFLFGLRYVPASLPFHLCRRLDFKPFRWAPRSFLGFDSTPDPDSDSFAIVTENGLLAEYPSVLLTPLNRFVDDSFLLQNCENNKWYLVMHGDMFVRWHGRRLGTHFRSEEMPSPEINQKLEPVENPALVFPPGSVDFEDGRNGLLVRVQGTYIDEGGTEILDGVVVCHVYVQFLWTAAHPPPVHPSGRPDYVQVQSNVRALAGYGAFAQGTYPPFKRWRLS